MAVQDGKEAARFASESKSLSEIIWAQIVLTLTMHAAGNRGWMAERERTYAEIEEWKRAVGKDAVEQYLVRPVVDRRYRKMKELM